MQRWIQKAETGTKEVIESTREIESAYNREGLSRIRQIHKIIRLQILLLRSGEKITLTHLKTLHFLFVFLDKN